MNIEAITATLTVSDALNGTINMTKPVALQDNKNASVSSVQQEITPDTGYDGLKKVTLAALNLQDKTVTLSSVQQTIEADTGYDGLGTVTVPPASAGDSVAKAMFGSDGYDANSVTVEATETKKYFNGVYMLENLKIVGATGMNAEVCKYWGNVKNVDIDCPYVAVSAFADQPLETIKLRNCIEIKASAFLIIFAILFDLSAHSSKQER